eukprot:m.52425 g.52425  ORF g.52425 m.52425 type:complete len:209 (+) comp15408_c0_seq17:375-1001(+)
MSSTNSATSCGPCARAMPSPWPKSSSSFTIRTHGMPCVGVPSCAAVECCGGIVAAACAHRRDARPPLADDGGGCGVQVPLSRAMGDIMGEIVMRVGQHGLVLRSEVASCIMSISVSEGLIFQLDPDLEILNFSVPYFVRYRSWTSAEQLMDYGYVTSERKSKDLVKGLENLALYPCVFRGRTLCTSLQLNGFHNLNSFCVISCDLSEL